jgi:hypothetical protein
MLSQTTLDPATDRTHVSPGDYVRFSRLRQSPKWFSAALLTALVYAAMPSIHVSVFGEDRVIDAIVNSVGEAMGAPIGSEGAERLRGALAKRDPITDGVVTFTYRLVQMLLMGFTMSGVAAIVDDIAVLRAVWQGVFRTGA